jgi:biotin carboxyl carrier protein
MSHYTLKINDRQYTAEVKEINAEQARIVVDEQEYTVDLIELGRRPAAEPVRATNPTPTPAPAGKTRPSPSAPTRAGTITAPLPGLILQLKVSEGDTVNAGQCVMVMEAMKMENQITAPHNGSVKKIFVGEGDSVGEGDALVEIARPEMTTL